MQLAPIGILERNIKQWLTFHVRHVGFSSLRTKGISACMTSTQNKCYRRRHTKEGFRNQIVRAHCYKTHGNVGLAGCTVIVSVRVKHWKCRKLAINWRAHGLLRNLLSHSSSWGNYCFECFIESALIIIQWHTMNRSTVNQPYTTTIRNSYPLKHVSVNENVRF